MDIYFGHFFYIKGHVCTRTIVVFVQEEKNNARQEEVLPITDYGFDTWKKNFVLADSSVLKQV